MRLTPNEGLHRTTAAKVHDNPGRDGAWSLLRFSSSFLPKGFERFGDHAAKLPSNQALKVMMAGCLKQAGGNKLILAVGSCSVSENFYVHITH